MFISLGLNIIFVLFNDDQNTRGATYRSSARLRNAPSAASGGAPSKWMQIFFGCSRSPCWRLFCILFFAQWPSSGFQSRGSGLSFISFWGGWSYIESLYRSVYKCKWDKCLHFIGLCYRDEFTLSERNTHTHIIDRSILCNQTINIALSMLVVCSFV